MWGPAAAGPPTPKHAGLASLSAHRKTQCGRLPRAEPLLREARVARTANSALLAVAPRTPTAALCACHPPPTPPLVSVLSCDAAVVWRGLRRSFPRDHHMRHASMGRDARPRDSRANCGNTQTRPGLPANTARHALGLALGLAPGAWALGLGRPGLGRCAVGGASDVPERVAIRTPQDGRMSVT